ncbi:PAS domain-containing sensor histidine kinase [Solimicrobium silvestre]|uniref:PAS domain S-box protein n=1 Tax=Solimicrobium silvestre TaxID=2099400 RepID=A0A2S9H2T2_9BURK|nr:PAS domain-containing sensor histidine kinase [Solimicrobium silvestre]PRC94295.1 PAS domain S-box protein [Solimicrobium silvestre]
MQISSNSPKKRIAAINTINASSLKALRLSESRYRRLFETAQDGILLLNADTAQIEDVNPYLINMLGYSHAVFLGKKLWEVGSFADVAESKNMFAELQTTGYVRYEDLPLKTKSGELIEVEFVSNTYECEDIKVIQCNIRNISQRKQVERELIESKAHLHQLSIFLQRAREEDRAHFSRELHDELGQNLTVLRIDFNGLANQLATSDPAIAARLDAIDQVIIRTVDATRLICEELRPGMLDDLGFEAAITSYARSFTKRFGVPCDLLLDREDYGLDKYLSTAIFRIVQEALTNIARHAQASHAMVALQDCDNGLLLTIADDGIGLPTELTDERKTFGILGMKERVNMLGGRIAIDSAPGRGTHIEVNIPRNDSP